MGLLGDGHNRATSLTLFTFMHWRRKWQPTPMFLPGESQGAWWVAICGVTQSQTRLKWLSSSGSKLRKHLWQFSTKSYPSGSTVKNPPAIKEPVSIPGLGRFPGGGHGNPLQYSCLESPMDREAWWATVHRVTKSWIWLKRMSTHKSKKTDCNSAENLKKRKQQ